MWSDSTFWISFGELFSPFFVIFKTTISQLNNLCIVRYLWIQIQTISFQANVSWYLIGEFDEPSRYRWILESWPPRGLSCKFMLDAGASVQPPFARGAPPTPARRLVRFTPISWLGSLGLARFGPCALVPSVHIVTVTPSPFSRTLLCPEIPNEFMFVSFLSEAYVVQCCRVVSSSVLFAVNPTTFDQFLQNTRKRWLRPSNSGTCHNIPRDLSPT